MTEPGKPARGCCPAAFIKSMSPDEADAPTSSSCCIKHSRMPMHATPDPDSAVDFPGPHAPHPIPASPPQVTCPSCRGTFHTLCLPHPDLSVPHMLAQAAKLEAAATGMGCRARAPLTAAAAAAAVAAAAASKQAAKAKGKGNSSSAGGAAAGEKDADGGAAAAEGGADGSGGAGGGGAGAAAAAAVAAAATTITVRAPWTCPQCNRHNFVSAWLKYKSCQDSCLPTLSYIYTRACSHSSSTVSFTAASCR